MINKKTPIDSDRIKEKVFKRIELKNSLGKNDRPWQEILSRENMKPENDRRFARFANDLVHGLEAVNTFPKGVTIFGSARFPQDHKYCQAAYEVGRRLAEENITVTTGGGPGIMEAANRGAFEQGGRSVGFNIKLETEQDLNPYTTDSMEFHYFFARKVMMTFASSMFIFFPGGFGTMDEFGDVLELAHTGKMPYAPIILFGKEFWGDKGLDDWFGGKMSQWKLIETGDEDHINEMENLPSDYGLIENARNLYHITDSVDEVIEIAKKTKLYTANEMLKRANEGCLFCNDNQ